MMTTETASTEHQGQLVAQYRRNNKWSRAKLAEALQVDVCTIYRMEKQSVIKKLLSTLMALSSLLMG